MRHRAALLLLAIPATLSAQRVANGNRIVSTEFPAATLEVARGMTYGGTQRFELYGVADAEQHFFAELEGNRIKRLLWIQFEGYLPTNTNTYDYRDETIQHAGRTWHRRISAVLVPPTESRPDSDGARARSFIKSKGWTIGANVMLERLVWLLDSPARHELMIIYMEDLADQGLTAADVNDGGKARERWPAMAQAFHARAVGAFTVREP
jgi:hypothetical protein